MIRSDEELMEEWENPMEWLECHTSGSTGEPKMIHLPKMEMIASALRSIHYFGLSADSLLYSCISPEFIGGKMVWIRANVLGCRFGYETPTNTPLKDYHGGAIDLISVVPSQLIYILANPSIQPFLRKILVGGAPINEMLRKKIVESGLEVYESYGMTETASHIALRRITIPQEPFKVLPGIKVFGSDGRMEIEIEGWQRIVTNDLVRFVSQNSFYIDGRADNIIISGGRKIIPEKIEEALFPHIPGQFCITSLPDDKWGERVVLAMADTRENHEDHFYLGICRDHLEGYEVPKQVIYLKELPLTSGGKISRKKLKEQAAERSLENC